MLDREESNKCFKGMMRRPKVLNTILYQNKFLSYKLPPNYFVQCIILANETVKTTNIHTAQPDISLKPIFVKSQ